jgi:hypothetical protein
VSGAATERPAPPPGGAGAEPLPTRRAAEIEATGPAGARWLAETLWLDGGVGIVGGPPKACKSWLALELAVAVASGRPALGRFAVRERGPALLFCAEDSPPSVRERLAAIAAARGTDLAALDLHVVLASSMRLEYERDQDRLAATVRAIEPRLLVLDPFIRLHRIDENNATEVASVLGYLRELQRARDVAVLVVHHARKSAGPGGVELRGSSDFRAWSDTNVYVRRRRVRDPTASGAGDVEVVIEHRSAASPPPFAFRLALEPVPHLEVVDAGEPAIADGQGHQAPAGNVLAPRILEALGQAPEALGLDEVRDRVRARNSHVLDALRGLAERGHVVRVGRRWALAHQS